MRIKEGIASLLLVVILMAAMDAIDMEVVMRHRDAQPAAEPKQPTRVLFIGDSGTPLLADSIGEMANWGSGWTCSDLTRSLDKTPVDSSVATVVISIGTNDLYSDKADVESLMRSVRKAYPSAKPVVVTGSYGWSGYVSRVDPLAYATFYTRFGCDVVPGFGHTKRHPDTESSKAVRGRIKLKCQR